MRPYFSIRTKLMLVALLLLLIPWMSYVYVREMKSFLFSGLESALNLTSRAVATVLHDRPELFQEQVQIDPEDEQADNDIYAVPLPSYINLDGNLEDWGEQAKKLPDDTELESFGVNQVLGYHGRYIYSMLQVKDDEVQFRKKGFLRVNAADHIRLSLKDPDRNPRRYTLIARSEGRMSIYLMDKDWQYPITGEPNYDLAAELKLTEFGYNVELRIPRFMLTSDTRIQLSVADVDDPETLAIESIYTTTPQSEADDFSRVLVQSAEIAKILQGLDRADTRIWVVDGDRNPRSVVGNILTKNSNLRIKPINQGDTFDYLVNLSKYYYGSFLNRVFSLIVEDANSELDAASVEDRNDAIIDRALNGEITNDRRPTIDKTGIILMSAHPVYLGDKVLGAVIVEQSTHSILAQQQSVLENVISVTLLVLLTVLASILFFASRLTLRISRLRDATDGAINRDGKIIHTQLKAEAKSQDEIGDLSRSVSNMLGRLSQYTKYLRGLPDTLAHEVSNPLNVVNSSLHNLAQENPEVKDSKYLDRATNGINRIGAILTNLTEAANLEQAIQNETREVFDLVELVENYVDGYQFSNPDQAFDIIINNQPLMVEATPDYVAQALDKLVDNAIDFAAPDTAITFKVQRIDRFAQIDVINRGSRLPEGMSERIFEPLVSLGRKDAQKSRLGMGLYIVKLIANYHGGDVIAKNLSGTDGVIFSFTLPFHNSQLADY